MFGKAVQAGFNTFRFFAVGAQAMLLMADRGCCHSVRFGQLGSIKSQCCRHCASVTLRQQ